MSDVLIIVVDCATGFIGAIPKTPLNTPLIQHIPANANVPMNPFEFAYPRQRQTRRTLGGSQFVGSHTHAFRDALSAHVGTNVAPLDRCWGEDRFGSLRKSHKPNKFLAPRESLG